MTEEDYYALDPKRAAQVTANSLTYAQILVIPAVLVVGFLYDMAGRRVTTVTMFVGGAIATMLFPLVAPSVVGYDVARILFVQTLIIAMSNPFINDYVTVQSRGVATGF